MRALDGERADVLAVAAGVAVERAADRAGNAGRELEARQLAVAALVDQLEEVGAAADVGGGAVELDRLDRVADHEARGSPRRTPAGCCRRRAGTPAARSRARCAAPPPARRRCARRSRSRPGRRCGTWCGGAAAPAVSSAVAERLAQPLLDGGGAIDHRPLANVAPKARVAHVFDRLER